jgi:hypothetical protein
MPYNHDIYWGLSTHEFKSIIWEAFNIFSKEDYNFSEFGVIQREVAQDMAEFIKLRVARKATRTGRHVKHGDVLSCEQRRNKRATYLKCHPNTTWEQRRNIDWNLRLAAGSSSWTYCHHQDILPRDARGWVKKFVLK